MKLAVIFSYILLGPLACTTKLRQVQAKVNKCPNAKVYKTQYENLYIAKGCGKNEVYHCKRGADHYYLYKVDTPKCNKVARPPENLRAIKTGTALP